MTVNSPSHGFRRIGQCGSPGSADVSTHPGPHERLDAAEGRPRRFFAGGLDLPISTPDLAADWSQCFVSCLVHFSNDYVLRIGGLLSFPSAFFSFFNRLRWKSRRPQPPQQSNTVSFNLSRSVSEVGTNHWLVFHCLTSGWFCPFWNSWKANTHTPRAAHFLLQFILLGSAVYFIY